MEVVLAMDRKKVMDQKAKILEIRLTSRWGGEETLSKYFNQKIEEFNELDNGITIVADNVTDEQQYFDKLSSQFGAGTQPNVFINYGGTSIKDYIDGGVLLDLEPYFEEDPGGVIHFFHCLITGRMERQLMAFR